MKKKIALAGLLSVCSLFAQTQAHAISFFSYDDYAYILKTYVQQDGLVDYAGIKKDRKRLDQFVVQMGKLDERTFTQLPEKQRLAFWINAYNALTLQGVINHYPMKSFRDVGSIFNSTQDKLKFKVMGKTMTLNHIEHKILRKEFNEPRLHVAINCAAYDCPRLRNDVYLPEKLESQLTEQSKEFIDHPDKFRIDTVKRKIYLSKIFKWLGDDWIPTYYGKGTLKGYSKEHQA
ncbi:MAG: DUF547 domain-containing protein, partial [Verrucomicrobiota bacterium]